LREQFIFGGGNCAKKSSNPEELGRIRLRERKGKVDQHLRHEILGSKPQKTQQILRSKFEAILGLFF
jgi:hypothetical protein